MNRVVLVDLADTAIVARLGQLTGPGGIRELGRVLGAEGWAGETISLPMRLLILDRRTTHRGTRISEEAISKLVEIDPPVRAIVLLVPDQGSRAEHLGDQDLPGLYSFPHIKVIEMRGDRLSTVYEGHTADSTEFPADERWADDYRKIGRAHV